MSIISCLLNLRKGFAKCPKCNKMSLFFSWNESTREVYNHLEKLNMTNVELGRHIHWICPNCKKRVNGKQIIVRGGK